MLGTGGPLQKPAARGKEGQTVIEDHNMHCDSCKNSVLRVWKEWTKVNYMQGQMPMKKYE